MPGHNERACLYTFRNNLFGYLSCSLSRIGGNAVHMCLVGLDGVGVLWALRAWSLF